MTGLKSRVLRAEEVGEVELGLQEPGSRSGFFCSAEELGGDTVLGNEGNFSLTCWCPFASSLEVFPSPFQVLFPNAFQATPL